MRDPLESLTDAAAEKVFEALPEGAFTEEAAQKVKAILWDYALEARVPTVPAKDRHIQGHGPRCRACQMEAA